MFDVIVVGAGPAGLSAALLLGRCCRRVLVCDTGSPRNARSGALHGYLSRDGIDPWEFRRLGRQELGRYGVEYREAEVTDARAIPGGFEVDLAEGARLRAKKLLLATGVRDRLPPHPGFADCYGRTVFHCPYCDGWEVRGKRLAVYAPGSRGVTLALNLKTWTPDVVLCTDGTAGLGAEQRSQLDREGVRWRSGRIDRLEHDDGSLRRIVFRRGDPEERDALFFATGQEQQSDLALRLGCTLNRKGTVRTGHHERTTVPGLFVAGDASHDVQLVVVAAAEGVKAAFAINNDLQSEGRQSRAGANHGG